LIICNHVARNWKSHGKKPIYMFS